MAEMFQYLNSTGGRVRSIWRTTAALFCALSRAASQIASKHREIVRNGDVDVPGVPDCPVHGGIIHLRRKDLRQVSTEDRACQGASSAEQTLGETLPSGLWLHPEGRAEHDPDMQEVLFRPGDAKAALRDQEFYELRLDDVEWDGEIAYQVYEAHAQWHDTVGGIAWDEKEFEQLPSLELAKERYEIRRKRLMQRGFTCSDMDM